jgi:hypothetical protein
MEKETKSKNEYPIELQAAYLGYKDDTKFKTFLRRKGKLIRRDPLYKELTKILTFFSYEPLPVISPEKKALYEKIPLLKGELEKKWNVEIDFTEEERYWANRAGQSYSGSDGPLIIRQGWFRGKDGKPYTSKAIALKAWRLNPDTQEKKKLKLKILPTDDRLLIDIDLNLGDQGEDGKLLKENVCSLIDRCLKQRKREGKKPVMIGEPQELAFLYHRREETLENYLRWYDLNIGSDYQKPKGYSFRAIAELENVRRNHPELYEDAKKQIANRTKVIRSTRGEKILKGFVGDPIKGEDAVEKGVKMIYSAIHRKSYPSKKTKQKEYRCPNHERSCPKDCPYFMSFMKDFNRRMMLFKPLNTTDPAVLPYVIGEGRSHSKSKPTADQQSNQQAEKEKARLSRPSRWRRLHPIKPSTQPKTSR